MPCLEINNKKGSRESRSLFFAAWRLQLDGHDKREGPASRLALATYEARSLNGHDKAAADRTSPIALGSFSDRERN